MRKDWGTDKADRLSYHHQHNRTRNYNGNNNRENRYNDFHNNAHRPDRIQMARSLYTYLNIH